MLKLIDKEIYLNLTPKKCVYVDLCLLRTIYVLKFSFFLIFFFRNLDNLLSDELRNPQDVEPIISERWNSIADLIRKR